MMQDATNAIKSGVKLQTAACFRSLYSCDFGESYHMYLHQASLIPQLNIIRQNGLPGPSGIVALGASLDPQYRRRG